MAQTPKPVMVAHATINLDDLKRTAQQFVDAAWSQDVDEARKAFRHDLYRDAMFEVVMETLYGTFFFDDSFNPRQAEVDPE